MATDAAAKTSLATRRRNVDWVDVGFRIALPFGAVLLALLIGAVMLLLLGVNPLEAYAAMIDGVFGSVSGFTQSLVKATPLLLVGLGICIAFRASVINIGGEGQIIVGALAGHLVPADLPHLARLAADSRLRCWSVFWPARLWGFIPGILKSAHEGQRNPQHGDDERHRPAVDEPADARPADGSGRRHRRHLPGPVGTPARAGLAGAPGAANPAAHRPHDRRRSWLLWSISSCGAPPLATASARWA